DEHDLEVGVDVGGAPGQLDAVHLGHDNIGKEQGEGLLGEAVVRLAAVGEAHYLVAGLDQGALDEGPHGVVILRQQNAPAWQAGGLGGHGWLWGALMGALGSALWRAIRRALWNTLTKSLTNSPSGALSKESGGRPGRFGIMIRSRLRGAVPIRQSSGG